VLDDDDPARLAARILEQEHQVYPRAIQLYAEDRLEIDGRRVRIKPAPTDHAHRTLVNPPLED
jgi:phosphoribosylglycinamide formyltransferase-1